MVHRVGSCFLFHSMARYTEAWFEWFSTRLVSRSGIKLEG